MTLLRFGIITKGFEFAQRAAAERFEDPDVQHVAFLPCEVCDQVAAATLHAFPEVQEDALRLMGLGPFIETMGGTRCSLHGLLGGWAVQP